MSDDFRDGGPSWEAPFFDDTPLTEFEVTTTELPPAPVVTEPKRRMDIRALLSGSAQDEPADAPSAMITSDLFSERMEKAVLGCALLDPYSVMPDLMQIIKAGDFYYAAHRIVWAAMVDLYQSGKDNAGVMDVALLGEILERRNYYKDIGGAPFISQLQNSAEFSGNALAYAQAIRDYSTRRMLADASAKILKRAYSLNERSEQAVMYAKQQIQFLETREAELATEDNSAAALFVDAYESHFGPEQDKAAIPTPFGKGVNDGLAGGWPIAQLSIIAGRQGGGKSSILGQQAQYTTEQAKRNRVIVASNEMTKAQWVLMMAAQKMGVSLLDKKRAEEAIAQYKAPETLRIFRAPNLMAEQLCARIRREAMQMGGVDLLIVDHWGLIDHAPKKRGLMLTAAIGASNKIAIALAEELQCALIIAVQLSRAGREGETKPELTHLRESGEYEQDGRRVAFIWRSNDDSTNTAPVVPAELIIAKNNDGPCFVEPLMYSKPKRIFYGVSKQ